MFCINCGNRILPDSAFCINCGVKLQQNEMPVQTVSEDSPEALAESVQTVLEDSPEAPAESVPNIQKKPEEDSKPKKTASKAALAAVLILIALIAGIGGAVLIMQFQLFSPSDRGEVEIYAAGESAVAANPAAEALPGATTPTASVPEPPPIEFDGPVIGYIVEFGGIDWRVLDRQGNRVLVISEYILEQRWYHHQLVDINWSDSDMRQYLNNEFLNRFTTEERNRIVETRVINNDNPWFGTSGGPDTTDYVFLLSLEEVVRYFGDSGQLGNQSHLDNERWGFNDRFNSDRRAHMPDGTVLWWWLRSPGSDSSRAAYVAGGGVIRLDGDFVVNDVFGGVRPAMWLNLETQTAMQPQPPPPIEFDGPVIGYIIEFGGIDWRVLDRQENRVLVISEYILEQRWYHHQLVDINWSDSDMRRYLNSEFLNRFNEAERARIIETTVVNDNNPWFGISGGPDTTDYVFLLSLGEVVRYFGDSGHGQLGNRNHPDNDARGFNDRYDDNRIARELNGSPWFWWLRSTGSPGNHASNVRRDGGISVGGVGVYIGHATIGEPGGMRPAMWLYLDAYTVLRPPSPAMPEPPPPIYFGALDIGYIIEFGGFNWRVLDRQGDRAFIISEYILEQRPYQYPFATVPWADSTIRQHLNGEFLNSFSEAERRHIAETTVINNDNPWFGTSGGPNTTDYVFLLSLEEVVRYFGDSGQLGDRDHPDNVLWGLHDRNFLWGFNDRYNDNRRAHMPDGSDSWWWLRSTGSLMGGGAGVGVDGYLNVRGMSVHDSRGGVRPVLWLNLDAYTVLRPPSPVTPTVIPAAPMPAPPPPPPDVGAIIEFGGISWRVLDRQRGKVLVISEYILEQGAYHAPRGSTIHAPRESTTWADSTIRRHLNGEFLNRFSEAERRRIIETTVVNDNNPWFDTNGGQDTTDYVFLLSLDELVRYFGDSRQLANQNHPDNEWRGFNDRYDDNRIARDLNGNASAWWLRSPGDNSNNAAIVGIGGQIVVVGSGIIGAGGGVRPAMWLYY